MIVHSLHVKNYCGIESMELSPLPKGITILEGPNEVGKSSLVRALYLLLDVPDDSKKDFVKKIQPVNRDVGPEIKATIQTGRYTFSLFKRYIKKPETELIVESPKHETLHGREAHNRVQEILKETMDIDLWKALNIIQGEKVTGIPSNSRLYAALSKAAGTVGDGTEESSLLDLVKQERDKYYTPTAKGKKGDFKAVSEAVETIELEVGILRERMSKAESDVSRQEMLTESVRFFKVEKGVLVVSLARANTALVQARAFMLELETTRKNQKTAEIEHRINTNEKELRVSLLKSIQEAEITIKEIEERHPDLRGQLQRAEQVYSDSKQTLGTANNEKMQASEAKDGCQADLDLLLREEEHSRWAKVVSSLESEMEAVAEAEKDLLTHTVTESVLHDILKANDKLERAKGSLERELPMVHLEAIGDVELQIDGESTVIGKGATQTRSVADGLQITVPNLINISIRRGKENEKATENVAKAQEHLDEFLRTHNLKDTMGAYASKQKRDSAQTRLKESKARIENEGLSMSLEELKGKAMALQAQIENYLSSRIGDSPLPVDIEDARGRLLAANDILMAKEKLLVVAREEAEKNERRRDDLRTKDHKWGTEKAEASGLKKAHEEALEIARGKLSDEKLESQLGDSQRNLESATRVLAEAETKAMTINIETLELLESDAKEALEKMDQRIIDSREEIKSLEGRLSGITEDGVFEKLGAKDAELHQKRVEKASLERQAEAACLLLETMESARQEAMRKYQLPFRNRIESMGRILHNDSFSVELDDKLQIVSRTLDGKTIFFDLLSNGAQEQLTVINRLACAIIVSAEGGVPLVLDDTLTHTDSMRKKAMAAILLLASRDCQLIIMTCDPGDYTSIGAAKVVVMRPT